MALDITSRFIIAAGVTGGDSVRGFTGSISTLEGAASRLRNMLGGLGIALSGAAFVNMIKGSIDAADRMRDLSQSTGVAVNVLSGLEGVAQKSGIGIDAVAKSIGFMARTMQSTPEKFIQFGISLAEIKSGSIGTQEALARVAERLATLPDGLQKSGLAAQAFGKNAAQMIPFINEGGEAIRKAAGYISQEFADAADKFNDKIVDMQVKFKGVGAGLAESLIPAFERFVDLLSSDAFQEGLKAVADFLADVAEFVVAHGKETAALLAAFAGAKVGGGLGAAFGPKGAAVGAIGGAVIAGGGTYASLAMQGDESMGALVKKTSELEAVSVRIVSLQKQISQIQTQFPGAPVTDQERILKTLLERKAALEKAAKAAAEAGALTLGPTADEITAAAKAEEERYKNTLKLTLDRIKAAEALDELDDKRAVSLEEYLVGLERDAELSGMSVELREELLALDKARELIGRDLTAGEEDRVRAALKLKEVHEAANRKAAESADEWKRIWAHASEGIQDSLAGAFRNVISGADNSFRDFFNSLKNLAFDVAAQIAAALIFRPLLDASGLSGLLSGAGGAAGAASFGGAALTSFGTAGGGMMGGLSAALGALSVLKGGSLTAGSEFMVTSAVKLAGLFTDNLGMLGNVRDAVSAFSSPLAGIGGFAGNMLLNSLLGNRGIGASIGSSLGGLAGSFLTASSFGGLFSGLGSFAGPVGAIAGSMLGNVVGGLFGGNSTNPIARGFLGFEGESFRRGQVTSTDGAPTEGITTALDQAIALLNSLTALERISVDPAKKLVVPGRFLGRGTFAGIVSTSKNDEKGGFGSTSATDLIHDIIQRGFITGLTEIEKTMLLGSQDIGAAIQKMVGEIAAVDELKTTLPGILADAILAFTDPKALAVQQLAAQQQGFRAQLQTAGLLDGLLAQVTQLEGLQLADVLKRFTDSVAGANDNFKNASDRISGFLSQLTASTQSPLPLGEALARARGEFAGLVSQAQAGGATKIAELTPSILDAAQRFNELNRAANASSPEFFNSFNAMTSTLNSLNLALGGSPMQAIQNAMLTNSTSQLSELQLLRAEVTRLTNVTIEMQIELRRMADAA